MVLSRETRSRVYFNGLEQVPESAAVVPYRCRRLVARRKSIARNIAPSIANAASPQNGLKLLRSTPRCPLTSLGPVVPRARVPIVMSNVRALVLPALTAVATVVVIGIAFKIYKSWSEKKKSAQILLVDPTVKYSLPLIEKDIISHDTRKFRFGLPTPNHVLGLPIGQHVHLTAKIGEEVVIRSYTPVSSDDDRSYVDLVIKVYFKNVHPKFPEGGKLSQYLENMKIGDTIDFRGPSGRLIYKGQGKVTIKLLRKEPPVEYNVKKMVMLAGGTGITPMLQLIRAIIKDPADETQTSLLFANQTEKDILLRDELDDIAKKYPNKLKLWYTLDSSSDGWPYSTGYISADMIEKHLFPPSSDTIVLMCGPPPMINFACTPNLDKLGYDTKLRFAY